MPKKTVLDRVEVSAPCSQNWNEMFGNDDVRFCHHCAKNVHNLSAITRKQAKRLVAQSKGNLCIQYIRRPDGRIQTVEPKLYKIAGRVSRIAAGVFGATLSLANLANAQTAESSPTPEVTIQQINQAGYLSLLELTKEEKEVLAGAGNKIYGTVVDPAGALIPGASVTLTNTKTSDEQTITSDENGSYQFTNLSVSTYKIKVEAAGFKANSTTAVELNGETKIEMTLATEVVVMGVTVSVSYENPLITAASDGDLEAVQKLLRDGADVNGKEENGGMTALHAAVENGNLEIVRELLQAGAKPNARTQSRHTPMMALDGDAKPELVRLLLTYGARVNSTDDAKAGVLLSAVQNYAEPEVLQLLIQAGAKVDAADKEGRTALIAAASDDNLEAVKVLLGAGADPNLKKATGETALSETGSEEVRQLLISYGAKGENADEKSEDKIETEKPPETPDDQ